MWLRWYWRQRQIVRRYEEVGVEIFTRVFSHLLLLLLSEHVFACEVDLEASDLLATIAQQMRFHILFDSLVFLTQLYDTVSILTLQAVLTLAIFIEILIAHFLFVALEVVDLYNT